MGRYNELLRKVAFFDGLDEDSLTQLSGRLKPMEFAKDALVVSQDDPGDAMFIIEHGRVKVVLYGETGREMILSMLRAGEVVGEMSLLDGQPRSANVIAVEESQLLSLSRQDFVELLKTETAIALNVLEEMSLRLRRADDVIGNLALLDVYGRVARVLVDMAERDGEEMDEGIIIKKRPTQQDLASMIGTSRETVSRVLGEFQRRGFISMQGKKIILSNSFANGGAVV